MKLAHFSFKVCGISPPFHLGSTKQNNWVKAMMQQIIDSDDGGLGTVTKSPLETSQLSGWQSPFGMTQSCLGTKQSQLQTTDSWMLNTDHCMEHVVYWHLQWIQANYNSYYFWKYEQVIKNNYRKQDQDQKSTPGINTSFLVQELNTRPQETQTVFFFNQH